MSFTDPVADFLTRIRNGIKARHQKVDAPASKLKLEIARVLKEEGYIANYKATEEEGKKIVRVYIKYNADNVAAINNIKRISRPGLPCVRQPQRDSPHSGRPGHHHPDHSEGRTQWQAGPQRRRGRRSDLRSLLTALGQPVGYAA